MKNLFLCFCLTALALSACEGAGTSQPSPAAPTVTVAATARAEQPPAVRAAVAALAQTLGLTSAQIKVVGVEPRQWANACLDTAPVSADCPAAPTPGLRLLLEAGGARHEFHTNLDGSRVAEAVVTLAWHQEEGGQCIVLTASTAGDVEAGSCNGEPAHGRLTAPELAQLQQWAGRFGQVTIVLGDPAAQGSALTTLELNGLGQAQPDEAGQQTLLDWSKAVYTRLAPTP